MSLVNASVDHIAEIVTEDDATTGLERGFIEELRRSRSTGNEPARIPSPLMVAGMPLASR